MELNLKTISFYILFYTQVLCNMKALKYRIVEMEKDFPNNKKKILFRVSTDFSIFCMCREREVI